MACVLTLTSLELILMLSAVLRHAQHDEWVICLPLAGWRHRAPAGKTSFQGGESRSGVFGPALPPQRIVQEGSPYSHGPSLRMDPAAAKTRDGLAR